MSVSPSPDDARRYMEAQRVEWRDAAPGLHTWGERMEVAWRPITDLLVAALGLTPAMRVLDVASGIGEPALTLAALVGPGGHVAATDLAPEMLAVAEGEARLRGVANLSFHVAPAESLPFDDVSFDAVCCRNGVMYFADVGRALAEMRRVLKPGGRVAVSAWGPPEHLSAAKTYAVIARHAPMPVSVAPDPAAPNMFRFAQAGTLVAALEAAGFAGVTEAMHRIETPWPGTIEERWRSILEMSPGVKRTVEALPEDRRAALVAEALDSLRADAVEGQVMLMGGPIVASGRR